MDGGRFSLRSYCIPYFVVHASSTIIFINLFHFILLFFFFLCCYIILILFFLNLFLQWLVEIQHILYQCSHFSTLTTGFLMHCIYRLAVICSYKQRLNKDAYFQSRFIFTACKIQRSIKIDAMLTVKQFRFGGSRKAIRNASKNNCVTPQNKTRKKATGNKVTEKSHQKYFMYKIEEKSPNIMNLLKSCWFTAFTRKTN